MRLFLLAILFTSTVYAQKEPTAAEINKKIADKLMDYASPNFAKLKDSVELYTFTIQLSVAKEKDKIVVREIVNLDSISNILFKDVSFLKEINYTSLLRNQNSATLVIPVAVIIAYVNKPIMTTPMVKVESLSEKLAKLFDYNYKDDKKLTSDFIYLAPIIVTAGTKVYN